MVLLQEVHMTCSPVSVRCHTILTSVPEGGSAVTSDYWLPGAKDEEVIHDDSLVVSHKCDHTMRCTASSPRMMPAIPRLIQMVRRTNTFVN